jgi:hypothetical protein
MIAKKECESYFQPYVLRITIETEDEHHILQDITRLEKTLTELLHERYNHDVGIIKGVLTVINLAIEDKPF